MNPLLNARFTEANLKRLDEFRELLVEAYKLPEAVEAVYNAKLYSLSRCEDEETAQRRLNFEISCLHSFTITLQMVREYEEANSFFNHIDELDEVFYYGSIVHEWQDRLYPTLRHDSKV